MKILYVTTISNTVNAFLIPHIKMLFDEGHQVDLAFNIEQELKPEIFEMGCKVHQLAFQRSPLKIDNFMAYKLLKNIIVSESYDLIHTHTPVASAIVRLVCKNFKNVKVFYTAHGFHFYKAAPLINWLIYYPIEKWLAKYTDVLITINKEDYERAKSRFNSKSVEYLPGVGINLRKYNSIDVDRISKRSDLGLPIDAFVVLSVGELNKNKNHEVIIRALAKINNPKIHYVICGAGLLESYLIRLSEKLEIKNNVHLLGYRNDISDIYKISDMFAFSSYREGLPVSLIEAMATRLPVVCSKIRGNVDLVENEIGGYLVGASDVNGFAKCIGSLSKSSALASSFAMNNQRNAYQFSENNVINMLRLLYANAN